MDLSADTWYRLGELLEPSWVRLKDGSSVRSSNAQFHGATVQILTGPAIRRRHGPEPSEPDRRYQYLHLVLQNVDRADLDGLPAPSVISSRLLRENLLYLSPSSYSYDALVRNRGETYYARGAVCAGWMLDPRRRSARDSLQRHREVAAAHRSGLLDDLGKSKAEFRLRIKPTMRRLTEVLDSGYLSAQDWQITVTFAHWYAERTEDEAPTPLAADRDASSMEHLEIRFHPHARRRDFRLSDLFDPGVAP